jgi:hypothetical protein
LCNILALLPTSSVALFFSNVMIEAIHVLSATINGILYLLT